MYHASVPLTYWDTIFKNTLFMINRLPSTPNHMMSPYEKLFHQSPDYQFLHTIGCECFPLLRPYNQHKLLPRSESCIFFGYSSLHKGYKCYHLPTQRLYIFRHAQFVENSFPFSKISPHSSTHSTQHKLSNTLTVLPSSSAHSLQPSSSSSLPSQYSPTPQPSNTIISFSPLLFLPLIQ
jgi:hypothetical protein